MMDPIFLLLFHFVIFVRQEVMPSSLLEVAMEDSV